MKTYVGRRSGGFCEVWVEQNGERQYDLSLYLHIRNHSPTGFEWGYGGSGPAQLSLALLCDYFTKEIPGSLPWMNVEAAEYLYQRFKFKVVGGLAQDGWRLATADIRKFIDEMRKEEKEEHADTTLETVDVCMGCSAERDRGECPTPGCTWGKDARTV